MVQRKAQDIAMPHINLYAPLVYPRKQTNVSILFFQYLKSKERKCLNEETLQNTPAASNNMDHG